MDLVDSIQSVQGTTIVSGGARGEGYVPAMRSQLLAPHFIAVVCVGAILSLLAAVLADGLPSLGRAALICAGGATISAGVLLYMRKT